MKAIFRHSVAAAVVIGGSVALVAALYFALLAWAVLRGGGLGGPLALPGMMLMAFAGAAFSVMAVLAPVTIVSELVRVRLRRTRFIEIPIATLLTASFVFALVHSHPLAIPIVVAELILVGAYWWILQAADVLVGAVERTWRLVSGVADALVRRPRVSAAESR